MLELVPKASLVPGMVPGEMLAPLWRQSIAAYFDSEPVDAVEAVSVLPTVHQYHLGTALFINTSFPAQRFRRDPGWMARHDDADHLVLQNYVYGTNSGRNGAHDFLEKPGNIYAVNLAFETEAQSTAAAAQSLVLPRELLRSDLAYLIDASGALFAENSAGARIFCDHMSSLDRHLGAASVREIPALIQATLGLLDSLASHGDIESGPARNATLRSLCRHIDRHLGDPGLGVDSLCRAFHCSRATLYRLFRPLGGVREYIQRRRLMACFRAIVSPKNEHRGIFDIALDHGFVSPSHFSSLFRAHFGLSPRAVREAGPGMALAGYGLGDDWLSRLTLPGRTAGDDAETMLLWGKTLTAGIAPTSD